MGKLTQVWLSDDSVPFETEAEMLAHEEIVRGDKLADNYAEFLKSQVTGYEYEIHSEDLNCIPTENIMMVIEYLQQHLKTREA